jgi:hypothetical protein
MVKQIIGFGKAANTSKEDISSDSGKELADIDTIMRNLSKEVISYQDFENTLLKELHTIRDMENNLQNVNKQVWGMRKLVIARDDIFRALMAEYNKNVAMDIAKCRSMFDAINKINQEMDASVKIAYTELSKLFVEQKHQIYSESEENKRMMNIISEDAKKLNTEIIIIAEQHNSLHQRLTTLYENISKIASERQRLK